MGTDRQTHIVMGTPVETSLRDAIIRNNLRIPAPSNNYNSGTSKQNSSLKDNSNEKRGENAAVAHMKVSNQSICISSYNNLLLIVAQIPRNSTNFRRRKKSPLCSSLLCHG